MQAWDETGLQAVENNFRGLGALPFPYSPKLDQKGGINHHFPTSYDIEVCTFGTVCLISFASSFPGVYYQMCIPGWLNGTPGIYEVGVDYPLNPFDTPIVTHRLFKPDHPSRTPENPRIFTNE